MIDKFNVLEYKNNFEIYREVKSKLIKGDFEIKQPLISIVIPTYKRTNLLKDAIDSALGQVDFNDYEIIVLDNEDEFDRKTETEELLETYENKKVLYYKNEKNIGMTGNWNRGIELANGKWITLLHDDDILHETFLRQMFNILKKNDKIDLLVSNEFTGNNFDKRCFEKRGKSNFIKKIDIYDLVENNIAAAPGIVFKKEKGLEIGGFNQSFYPCADYAFWINFVLKYNAYKYSEELVFYRTVDSITLKGNTLYNMAIMVEKIQKDLIRNKKGNKLYKKMINYVSIFQWYSTTKKMNIDLPKEFKKSYLIRTIFSKIIRTNKLIRNLFKLGYYSTN